MLDSAHMNYKKDLGNHPDPSSRKSLALRFREHVAYLKAELKMLEDDSYWTIDPKDERLIFGKFALRFPHIRFFVSGSGYVTLTGSVVSLVFPVSQQENPELAKIALEKRTAKKRELAERIQEFNARPEVWRRGQILRKAAVMREFNELVGLPGKTWGDTRTRLEELYEDEVLKLIPTGLMMDRSTWRLKFPDRR